MTDQEIQEQAEKMSSQYGDSANVAKIGFIKGAKWMQENKCRHRLVSAKNDIIQDGFFCVDCGELFGEYKNDVTPPKDKESKCCGMCIDGLDECILDIPKP